MVPAFLADVNLTSRIRASIIGKIFRVIKLGAEAVLIGFYIAD